MPVNEDKLDVPAQENNLGNTFKEWSVVDNLS